MKQSKKLDSVNQKINELKLKKKELEEEMVRSLSQKIASILIKKNVTKIDVPEFIKKVEKVINEMMNK
jgi:hypothetical protein